MDVELKTNNMTYTPFKMKGNPMKRNFGISPMKQDTKKKSKGLNEIDKQKGIDAANDASDKVKFGPRHGSKLKDKTGWTKTPGTNTWKNDAYEAKIEKRKASEKASKARSDEDYKNKFGK